jgi:hypothetical protein
MRLLPFANLTCTQRFAHQGRFRSCIELTNLISFDDVLNVADSNKEIILANTDEDDAKMYRSAFLSLQSSIQQAGGREKQVQVVAFDDENSNSELVYGIDITQ